MQTHCSYCGTTIYDSDDDLCTDCENKYEPKGTSLRFFGNGAWRYQMHRDMADIENNRLAKSSRVKQDK